MVLAPMIWRPTWAVVFSDDLLGAERSPFVTVADLARFTTGLLVLSLSLSHDDDIERRRMNASSKCKNVYLAPEEFSENGCGNDSICEHTPTMHSDTCGAKVATNSTMI